MTPVQALTLINNAPAEDRAPSTSIIPGYGTLSTGIRILPVALSLGLFSVLGANLAARLGTRVIVCAGLVLLGGAFAWIGQTSATFPYPLIAIQMVMMGSGA